MRAFDLNDAVLAQRQFLRGLHFTVGVGIESAGLCPGVAGFRVVDVYKRQILARAMRAAKLKQRNLQKLNWYVMDVRIYKKWQIY